MPLIRPEVTAAFSRWREVWVGACVVLAGFWLVGLGGWFFGTLGLFLGAVGLGVALVGLRRLRARGAWGGPGVVEVVEGQITYLAAEEGGFVARSEITEVAVLRRASGPVWRIAQAGGPTLEIPAGARGAEAVYDLVAALPGARPGHILARLEAPPRGGAVTVWRRDARTAVGGPP